MKLRKRDILRAKVYDGNFKTTYSPNEFSIMCRLHVKQSSSELEKNIQGYFNTHAQIRFRPAENRFIYQFSEYQREIWSKSHMKMVILCVESVAWPWCRVVFPIFRCGQPVKLLVTLPGKWHGMGSCTIKVLEYEYYALPKKKKLNTLPVSETRRLIR